MPPGNTSYPLLDHHMLEDHWISASINRIWPALNFPVTRLPWYFSNSCRINISAEQAAWNPPEPTFGACHGIHGKLEVWRCCQPASALTSTQEPHSPATHAWWRECLDVYGHVHRPLSPSSLAFPRHFFSFLLPSSDQHRAPPTLGYAWWSWGYQVHGRGRRQGLA